MSEEERANSAAQKFFSQSSQFAARVMKEFGGAPLLAGQENSLRFRGYYQRRPRRQSDA